MNILRKKTLSLLTTFIFLAIASSFAIAEEINLPGFTGNINTTVSSGLTIRASKNDCLLNDGFSYDATADYAGQSASTKGLIANAGNGTGSSVTRNTPYGTLTGLQIGSRQYGCATRRGDAYGNMSIDNLPLGSITSDDGRNNFRDFGSVVDATQKIYSEIIGTTDSGISVNASLVGTYNPTMDINAPEFKKLSSAGESQYETDTRILNAYVNIPLDDADITAGRFVTSWGESTFIPIGMNGFVTNALDLTKLRGPGASIRDALMPTEQVSLSFYAGDIGVEVYGQFNAEEVIVDPAGTFFGSDLFKGTANDASTIPLAGAFDFEMQYATGCEWLAVGSTTSSDSDYGVVGEGRTCNEATITHTRANHSTYNSGELFIQGFQGADTSDWTTGRTEGGAKAMNLADGHTHTNLLVSTVLPFHSTLSDLEGVYDRMKASDYKNNATLTAVANSQKFVYAKDSGQFGVRASGFADIGNGIDYGIYFANYHSKVPYLRFVGKKGFFSGDTMSLLLDVAGDLNGAVGDNNGSIAGMSVDNGEAAVTAAVGGDLTNSMGLDSTDATQVTLSKALVNAMYGNVCSALGKVGLESGQLAVGAEEGKEFIANLIFGSFVNNELVENANNCYSIFDRNASGPFNATATRSQLGAFMFSTAILTGAVAPLNEVTYQFVYPEDNQVFGISGSTVVDGTMVQGELAFRPDFPLATNGWDQVAQIMDVSGVTAGLTAFGVHNTTAGGAASATIGTSFKASLGAFATAVTDAYTANSILDDEGVAKTWITALRDTKRSSLTPITQATAEASDYNATAYINYDVLSGTLGTTTTFNASHPLTTGLGADSAALLTEFGFVQINDLNDARGYVARGSAGFNEGSGQELCLGAFQDLAAADPTTASSLGINHNFASGYNALIGSTYANMGASVVDSLFGNGSYCEGQNGADSFSTTYRVIGTASYFNVNNSPWTMSPRFVWSHDPMGYGPSSLGGFSEGRMTLSLGTSFNKGDSISVDLSYVNELGDEADNLRGDMDYMQASVSYSF